VARMGGRRGVYRVLIGRPEGRRPLGRSRRRWEDNIRMNARETPLLVVIELVCQCRLDARI
jgi:hypothetical protein